MAVLLTKIVDGKPAVADTLPNEQNVKCPRCEQTYRLGYTDDEWHRLSAWLGKARTRCGRATRQGTKLRSWNCVGRRIGRIYDSYPIIRSMGRRTLFVLTTACFNALLQ